MWTDDLDKEGGGYGSGVTTVAVAPSTFIRPRTLRAWWALHTLAAVDLDTFAVEAVKVNEKKGAGGGGLIGLVGLVLLCWCCCVE